jgi:hypothetical protein
MTMTILQLQPAVALMPTIETAPEQALGTEISKFLAAYEESVAECEQTKRSIESQKVLARKKGIRLPEVERWDAYGYHDLGETVATLVRYELQEQPQRWLPIFEAQYQWEIPSSNGRVALFLTEKSKITRQIGSILRGVSRREILPLNHPLIVENRDDIIEGIVAMRVALEFPL